VDFARVVPWRLAQLRAAFAGFRQQADADSQTALNAWDANQRDWLDDYSLFMALETAHHGAPWWQWSAVLRDRDDNALAAARQTHAEEIAFWRFVQWCFDTQMDALKRYANERGVLLMSDLPIFIAHHSADCWARPDLYFLDADCQPTVVAGCPPDAMAPTGQRWGNPLYRWDHMAAEGYAWWSARVRRALAQADIFRIDHFRGFAGYYEIPADCPTAERGEWLPGPGKALFDAITRDLGELPIVAEDLGLITADVVQLREDCGFPGMKILQFGFGTDASDEFLPHNWQRDCVAYTGTHDNDTVRGPRQRHRARLVASRQRHRTPLRRQLPGRQRRRHPLVHDPRLLQLGRRHGDLPPARRPRPGRQPPHEHPRHHGPTKLVLAL